MQASQPTQADRVFDKRRASMTTQSTKSHRHELVHGEDGDFIAYQLYFGDGVWQTISTRMIPYTRNC
jgi:hypothetical protein